MRWARRSAWLLASATLVIAVAGLALMAWDWSAPVPKGFFGVRGFAGLYAAGFGGVGALLTWRRPGHLVGWILAVTGLVEAVDFATFEYGLAASAGRSLPGSAYIGWVQLWIWVPFAALVAVYLVLLFPDGRVPSPRWRPVGWLAGACAVIAIAGIALSPGSERPNLPRLGNPFGVSPATVPFGGAVVGLAGLAGCVVLAVWSLVARGRRGTATERQQIKWLARRSGFGRSWSRWLPHHRLSRADFGVRAYRAGRFSASGTQGRLTPHRIAYSAPFIAATSIIRMMSSWSAAKRRSPNRLSPSLPGSMTRVISASAAAAGTLS